MTLHEIARYLPSRDELSRALAQRSRRGNGGRLGLMGLGALLGAAGALLVAPKRGQELRHDLACRAEGLRESLRHAGENFRQSGNGAEHHSQATQGRLDHY